MTCEPVRHGGIVAIVCSRGGRRKRCACGRPATKLCDQPMPHGGTCDARLCDRCAVNVGPLRRRELAAIHTAKKQLGLDDDTYRDLLAGVTGKRSAAELTAAERTRVIERLRELGFGRSSRRGVYHAKKEHRLIAALWRDLWLLGEVEEPGPRALDHFVQRQAGVAALKWLAPEHAHSVVEALKDWLRRAGFTMPSVNARDIKRSALQRLVKAQWTRLEAAGAVRFESEAHRRAALDAYFDKHAASCAKGVDHPMTTAAELDACAEKLGAWIRRKRAERSA